MERGIIFDISHYMTEDGPGIRTAVFLKGCPLRCKWCSNVYGLKPGIQEGCRDGKSFTIGREASVSEILSEVALDRPFYRRGNGGLTLSGGEILMQPGFARALLKSARELGIHTAIETSGYGQWGDLKMLIDECDVVFMDCKCMDDRLHKKLTGVSNERILENIKLAAAYCAAGQKIFILRFPLIPKCNDREENICSTAELAKSLSVELNVLPYHNYGMDKYGTVGQAYGLKNVAPPDKNRLHQVALLLEETGVLYSIGGAEVKSY